MYSVTTESFLISGFPRVMVLRVMVPMAMFIVDEFICLGNSIFINSDMQITMNPRTCLPQLAATAPTTS